MLSGLAVAASHGHIIKTHGWTPCLSVETLLLTIETVALHETLEGQPRNMETAFAGRLDPPMSPDCGGSSPSHPRTPGAAPYDTPTPKGGCSSPSQQPSFNGSSTLTSVYALHSTNVSQLQAS